MSLPTPSPRLAPPPRDYESRTFANWVQQLDLFFKQLNNGGPITASKLTLTDLPTSSVGLRSGEVWHDTLDNTLKIVP